MKNQVIKVLTKKHGAKVIAYWKSIGVNTKEYTGSHNLEELGENSYIYYGMISNEFSSYPLVYVLANNCEIIELPKEKVYPRVMEVSGCSDFSNSQIRVVFMEKCGTFMAWSDKKTLKEAESETRTTCWGFAREIEELKEVHLTLQDISDGKGIGVPVNLLRIKQ